MPSDTVALSYIHDVDIAHSFHDSLVNLLMFDAANEQRIIRGGYIPIRCTRSAQLDEARNRAATEFLKGDAEWLFFVDTDMGFTPDTLERLLASADPEKRPVVGALCFAQREIAHDGMSGFIAVPRFTIMDWVDQPDGTQKFMGRTTYPINSLVPCAGTGAACILMHRSVFERIKEEHGPTWYNRIRGTDGTLLGEDTSFCVRVGALGFPIYVDTAIKTSHLKNIWLQERDFWEWAMAPPATQPVDVIVPVLGRPQNAEPFMRSLRATTGLATVYAIAGPENTAEAHQATVEAWKTAGAEVITGPGVTFAEKVNRGYRATSGPWLFVVGDDVRFHPGWLDHAQAVASDRYHVIGTNDLGNPRVTSGDHATHFLVRRSYVDEVGASWDGPGVVAHEGYRHWFVDDEIVNTAKQRGVWAMALGSRVEHLHPAWGKGKRDEVYDLGTKEADRDRALFEKRLMANLGEN